MNESHDWGLFSGKHQTSEPSWGGETGSASGGLSKHLPCRFACVGPAAALDGLVCFATPRTSVQLGTAIMIGGVQRCCLILSSYHCGSSLTPQLCVPCPGCCQVPPPPGPLQNSQQRGHLCMCSATEQGPPGCAERQTPVSAFDCSLWNMLFLFQRVIPVAWLHFRS